MTEKARKRKNTMIQIEVVLESTCRNCVFGVSNVKGDNCGGCKADEVLKELGVELNGGKSLQTFDEWTPEQDREMIKLFANHTTPEVAEIIGRSKGKVRNRIDFLRKKGFEVPRKPQGGQRKWTPELDQRLIELYLVKETPEIAKILGVSQVSAERRIYTLRRLGADVPKKRKGVKK